MSPPPPPGPPARRKTVREYRCSSTHLLLPPPRRGRGLGGGLPRSLPRFAGEDWVGASPAPSPAKRGRVGWGPPPLPLPRSGGGWGGGLSTSTLHHLIRERHRPDDRSPPRPTGQLPRRCADPHLVRPTEDCMPLDAIGAPPPDELDP